MTQVQANVNMPHPTPPNPNPIHNVASTSWRKCKRTLTCPTPPNPNPIHNVASTSWRKCKRTLTCPTPPNPNPIHNVASTSWRKCKRTLTCPTPPNPNPIHNVASTSWRKCKRTLTCPTPPHPTPTPRGLRSYVTKMSNLWAGKRSDCKNMHHVCLKMLCTPKPNGFADHYPYENGYFIGKINPTFSDKPICLSVGMEYHRVFTDGFRLQLCACPGTACKDQGAQRATFWRVHTSDLDCDRKMQKNSHKHQLNQHLSRVLDWLRTWAWFKYKPLENRSEDFLSLVMFLSKHRATSCQKVWHLAPFFWFSKAQIFAGLRRCLSLPTPEVGQGSLLDVRPATEKQRHAGTSQLHVDISCSWLWWLSRAMSLASWISRLDPVKPTCSLPKESDSHVWHNNRNRCLMESSHSVHKLEIHSQLMPSPH